MRLNQLLLAALLVLVIGPGHANEVVDIPSVHGISTRTLIAPAQAPKATVLLFIGGGGLVKIMDSGRTDHGHTFVRSFGLWRDFGVQAVLIDSPLDLGNAMRGHKRASKEHLDRVSEVIRHFHAKSGQPLWIFGHSMGTSTVAAFLSSGRPEIAHLRGYVVAGTHRGESIPASIKLPALAIHHRREGCPSTPIAASEAIIQSRSPDTPKAMVLLDGGQDVGDRCQALAHHGFNGIEQELVKTAAEFLLKY
jgi:pimeloyl-ACP methyl ester carboxylesterase